MKTSNIAYNICHFLLTVSDYMCMYIQKPAEQMNNLYIL